MKASSVAVALVGLLLSAGGGVWAADDAKEQAIKRDREKIAGVWRAVELVVDGNRAEEADARKITVVNGTDGTWTLYHDGTRIAHGTSTFDPAKTPKTIDFTPTEGDAASEKFHGIYELGDKRRKLCFGPADKPRPTQFESQSGSDHILVVFEREKE